LELREDRTIGERTDMGLSRSKVRTTGEYPEAESYNYTKELR